MENKFNIFLEIAKKLNECKIEPILYGSLGLYRLIGELDTIHDIDIIIPNENLIDKFEELKNAMAELGYRQDMRYPHEFTKGDGQIGFEPESDLKELGISSGEIKTVTVGGIKFRELTKENFLVVYRSYKKVYQGKMRSIDLKIEKLEEINI